MKNKKHNKILTDYDKAKSDHLERLANKLLKQDETNQKLKKKPVKGNFLKKF